MPTGVRRGRVRSTRSTIRRLLLAALVVTVACLAAVNASAALASGGWSGLRRVDQPFKLYAVSCPSTSFCMATDEGGDALTFNGSSWSAPTVIDSEVFRGSPVRYGLVSVSCPSSSFCAAVDERRALTYNGSSWSAPTELGHLTSVSCASSSFCVAVGSLGNGAAASNYTSETWTYNGSSWSAPVSLGSGPFVGTVSCPKVSFCAAVSEDNALTYNGSSWSAPTRIDSPVTDASSLESVSCASTSFCVAVDTEENALIYQGRSWSAPTRVGAAHTVSCPSASFCMSVRVNGPAFAYSGGSWSEPMQLHVPAGSDGLHSVSCVSASFCVAVGPAGVDTYRPSKRERAELGVAVQLTTVNVTSRNVVAAVTASRGGTVTITGPGIRKTVKTLTAGSHRVTLALNAAGLLDRKNHKSTKLVVSLKTGGKTVSNSKIVKL